MITSVVHSSEVWFFCEEGIDMGYFPCIPREGGVDLGYSKYEGYFVIILWWLVIFLKYELAVQVNWVQKEEEEKKLSVQSICMMHVWARHILVTLNPWAKDKCWYV